VTLSLGLLKQIVKNIYKCNQDFTKWCSYTNHVKWTSKYTTYYYEYLISSNCKIPILYNTSAKIMKVDRQQSADKVI